MAYTAGPRINHERFWQKVHKSRRGCWEWGASTQTNGYGRVSVQGKPVAAHRVSWEMEHGLIPDRLFVLHRCDNKICVRPSHFFLGDHRANSDDKLMKGREAHVNGERNGHAKLTEWQVREMRRLHGEGLTCTALSQKYAISRVTAWQIVNRRRWRHIR